MRPVKIHYDAGQQKAVDHKLAANMMAIIVLRYNNRYLNILKPINNPTNKTIAKPALNPLFNSKTHIMATDFDKYSDKGNELLKMLADDLQVPDHNACRILRAVLHTIRNHLTVEESLQMVAQLPMMVKALYVDQWHMPQPTKRIHHVTQFLDEIRECDKKQAGYDFGNDESAAKAVKAVFRTLNYYISDGEFEDITAVLPTEIKDFIIGSIGTGRMAL